MSAPETTAGTWNVIGPVPTSFNRHIALWDVEASVDICQGSTFADASLIAASNRLYETLEHVMADCALIADALKEERGDINSARMKLAVIQARSATALAIARGDKV